MKLKTSGFPVRLFWSAVLIVASSTASAEVAPGDLIVTGLNPTTGVVEVTNFGVDALATPAGMRFSGRQNEPTDWIVPTGTTFDPGQTRTFTLMGLDSVSGDLWLYLDDNFTSPASIISGLVYGGTAFPNRIDVAVAAGIWPSAGTFLPAAILSNQSLQMIGFDRADPGDWAVVTFSLGSYFGDGAEIGNPLPSIVKGPVAVEIETLVATASQPLGVAFIDPGDLGRFIYYEKTGRVRLVDEGALQSGDFLSVAGRLVNLGGANDERGLLGLTLHPDFASNRLLYTYTSEPIAGSPDFTAFPGGSTNHHAVIAEWAVDASDPDAVDVATRREILRIAQPQGNHNGGALRFGPDGMLYIALGDGGGADDEGGGHAPEGNGQRTDVILGSILRIDVGGNNSANGRYGVPATNPFVGGAGIDEIFHYGLRNPFSFSFDSLTGEIYIGDVGQRDIEEVNRLAAGVVGVNFGWRLKEGTFFFDPTLSAVVTIPVAPIPPGVVDPIAQYDHGDGSSAIGGFVYRGSAIPELAGRYVCADLNGKLFYIDAAGTLLQLKIGLDDRAFGTAIVGFGQDPAGEIYVCGGVGLFKLIPIPAPAAAKGWAGYRKR